MEPEETTEVLEQEPVNPADEDSSGFEVVDSSESAAEPETEDDAGEEEAAAEEPKKDRVQDRISELTRKRREAEQEAAYWRGRAEAQAKPEEATEPEQPAQAQTPATKPQEGDFEDYSEFVEALADWKTDQRLTAMEQRRQKEQADKHVDTWKATGAQKFSDFEAVVMRHPKDGGPAITGEMAQVINDSPLSHEIAYHLGKNVDESYRIAGLSPLQAAMELGKLEAKLSGPTPLKPKTVSSAPEPIKPLSTSRAGVEVPLEKLSEKDYIARRNREEFGPNWRG